MTQDTEDVVAELRSYATWARTRFPGDSATATKAADLIEALQAGNAALRAAKPGGSNAD